MKFKYLLTISFLSSMFLFLMACTKEWKDANGIGPEIQISDDYQSLTGINVGDEVSIPVTVSASTGIKRLSYFFVRRTANGTASGTPVNIDREDLPTELQHSINFTIEENMTELVVISFNKENFSTEVHITMSEIRQLPVLTFKDNIKFQETVFADKEFNVEGVITSAFDLEKISFQTAIDGSYSNETAIAFTDKRNTPFTATVNVVEGLTAIVIKAENIYGGYVTDTFRIGSVAEDAVTVALAGGNSEIGVIYADSANKISANIVSGSDVQSLSYAVKRNGNYGAEQAIELSDPFDAFSFDFSVTGEKGIEAIRISAENEGGKSVVTEFPVTKVYSRLLLRQTYSE